MRKAHVASYFVDYRLGTFKNFHLLAIYSIFYLNPTYRPCI